MPALAAADRVLGVHAIGENDVDDVDVGVFGDVVVVVIGVDIFGIDAALAGEGAVLIRMAGDQGDRLAIFGLHDAGEDLALGEGADADDGEAELFGRGTTRSRGAGGNGADGRRGEGGGSASEIIAARKTRGDRLHENSSGAR